MAESGRPRFESNLHVFPRFPVFSSVCLYQIEQKRRCVVSLNVTSYTHTNPKPESVVCAPLTLWKTVVGGVGMTKTAKLAALLILKWLLQRWRPGVQPCTVSCRPPGDLFCQKSKNTAISFPLLPIEKGQFGDYMRPDCDNTVINCYRKNHRSFAVCLKSVAVYTEIHIHYLQSVQPEFRFETEFFILLLPVHKLG